MVASFVVFASVLVQQIVTRTMIAGASDTPAAADLVIGERQGKGTTTAVLRQVRELRDVAEATGRTEIFAAVGGASGEPLRIAGDPGHGPLAKVRVLQGNYPKAGGEIAVTAKTAQRMDLPVGAVTTARIENCVPGPAACTDPEPVKLIVTAVVDADSDFGQDSYAPDIAVAALGRTDRVSRIDVRLVDGADLASTRRLLAGIVAAAGSDHPGVRSGAATRAAEAQQKLDQLSVIFILVGMFVAIAVVAAGLVATSTFRIVFAARMRQLALLRLVGGGRGGLVRALVIEGSLTGLVAGAAGVLLALAFGQALPFALKVFGQNVVSPGIPVFAAVAVIAGASLVSVLAVLAPALSAARVAPLEALSNAATTQGRRGIGVLRGVTGRLLAAGGVLAAYQAIRLLPEPNPEGYDPVPVLALVVVSATLAFVALVCLGPIIVRPLLWAAGRVAQRLGPISRLAVAGVGAAPRRAAAVSVVVALGVTLLSGVLIGGASLRGLSERELALAAPADFQLLAGSEATLPTRVVEQARGSTELAHIALYRRLNGMSLGTSTRPGGVPGSVDDLDLAALPQLRRLDTASGSLAGLGPGKVVLDRSTSLELGLRSGDHMVLSRGSRTVRVRVAAVLPDRTPLGSSAVADPADLNRLAAPAAYSGLFADAARPGESGLTAARKTLRRATGDADGVNVVVLADQREEITTMINALIGIAAGLVGLTLLIAVVGAGTTTALTVVERTRESGVLRAVGMSGPGLRAMLIVEASLYGMIGAILGLALGVPYAGIAVRATGIGAPLTVPAAQLTGVFLGLIALTALAGVLPAWRTSRISPLMALGTDV